MKKKSIIAGFLSAIMLFNTAYIGVSAADSMDTNTDTVPSAYVVGIDDSDTEKVINLTFSYFDSNNTEIHDSVDKEYKITSDISFDDMKEEIEGYEFKQFMIGDSIISNLFTKEDEPGKLFAHTEVEKNSEKQDTGISINSTEETTDNAEQIVELDSNEIEIEPNSVVKVIYDYRLEERSLEAVVDNYKISAVGNIPTNAEIKVEKLTSVAPCESLIKKETDSQEFTASAGFDIKIMVGDEEWQPIDFDEKVTITITNIDTSNLEEIEVYRIEDKEVTKMDSGVNLIGDVYFNTDHFTIYVIGGKVLDYTVTYLDGEVFTKNLSTKLSNISDFTIKDWTLEWVNEKPTSYSKYDSIVSAEGYSSDFGGTSITLYIDSSKYKLYLYTISDKLLIVNNTFNFNTNYFKGIRYNNFFDTDKILCKDFEYIKINCDSEHRTQLVMKINAETVQYKFDDACYYIDSDFDNLLSETVSGVHTYTRAFVYYAKANNGRLYTRYAKNGDVVYPFNGLNIADYSSATYYYYKANARYTSSKALTCNSNTTITVTSDVCIILYTATSSVPTSVFPGWSSLNTKLKTLGDVSTVKNIRFVDSLDSFSENKKDVSDSSRTPIYAEIVGDEILLYTEAERISFYYDCYDMLKGFSSIESVDFLSDTRLVLDKSISLDLEPGVTIHSLTIGSLITDKDFRFGTKGVVEKVTFKTKVDNFTFSNKLSKATYYKCGDSYLTCAISDGEYHTYTLCYGINFRTISDVLTTVYYDNVNSIVTVPTISGISPDTEWLVYTSRGYINFEFGHSLSEYYDLYYFINDNNLYVNWRTSDAILKTGDDLNSTIQNILKVDNTSATSIKYIFWVDYSLIEDNYKKEECNLSAEGLPIYATIYTVNSGEALALGTEANKVYTSWNLRNAFSSLTELEYFYFFSSITFNKIYTENPLDFTRLYNMENMIGYKASLTFPSKFTLDKIDTFISSSKKLDLSNTTLSIDRQYNLYASELVLPEILEGASLDLTHAIDNVDVVYLDSKITSPRYSHNDVSKTVFTLEDSKAIYYAAYRYTLKDVSNKNIIGYIYSNEPTIGVSDIYSFKDDILEDAVEDTTLLYVASVNKYKLKEDSTDIIATSNIDVIIDEKLKSLDVYDLDITTGEYKKVNTLNIIEGYADVSGLNHIELDGYTFSGWMFNDGYISFDLDNQKIVYQSFPLTTYTGDVLEIPLNINKIYAYYADNNNSEFLNNWEYSRTGSSVISLVRRKSYIDFEEIPETAYLNGKTLYVRLNINGDCNCKSLKLDIDETKFSDGSPLYVKNCNDLESIELNNCNYLTGGNFDNCSKLKNIYLHTYSGSSLSNVFTTLPALETLTIDDLSSCTSLGNVVRKANNLKTVVFKHTENIQSITRLFVDCTLDYVNIEDWDVSSLRSVSELFESCNLYNFHSIKLGKNTPKNTVTVNSLMPGCYYDTIDVDLENLTLTSNTRLNISSWSRNGKSKIDLTIKDTNFENSSFLWNFYFPANLVNNLKIVGTSGYNVDISKYLLNNPSPTEIPTTLCIDLTECAFTTFKVPNIPGMTIKTKNTSVSCSENVEVWLSMLDMGDSWYYYNSSKKYLTPPQPTAYVVLNDCSSFKNIAIYFNSAEPEDNSAVSYFAKYYNVPEYYIVHTEREPNTYYVLNVNPEIADAGTDYYYLDYSISTSSGSEIRTPRMDDNKAKAYINGETVVCKTLYVATKPVLASSLPFNFSLENKGSLRGWYKPDFKSIYADTDSVDLAIPHYVIDNNYLYLANIENIYSNYKYQSKLKSFKYTNRLTNDYIPNSSESSFISDGGGDITYIDLNNVSGNHNFKNFAKLNTLRNCIIKNAYSNLFYNCYSLTDWSGIKFRGEPDSIQGWFQHTKLTNSDLDLLISNGLYLNDIEDADSAFNSTQIQYFDLTKFPRLKSAAHMLSDNAKLTNVTFPESYHYTDIHSLLAWDKNLEEVDFNHISADDVTGLCYYAESLKSILNDDNLYTDNTSWMFENTALTSFDLSKLKDVKYASYMFTECKDTVFTNMTELQELIKACGMFMQTGVVTADLTNATKLRDIAFMFTGCDKLESVTLNSENLTYIESAFSGCTKLVTILGLDKSNNITYNLDLYETTRGISGHYKTNADTDLDCLPSIFLTYEAFASYYRFKTFTNCSSLKTVNLGNQPNLKTISGMFEGCTNLEEVDMSGLTGLWQDTKADDGYIFGILGDVFEGCTNLKRVKTPSNMDCVISDDILNSQPGGRGIQLPYTMYKIDDSGDIILSSAITAIDCTNVDTDTWYYVKRAVDIYTNDNALLAEKLVGYSANKEALNKTHFYYDKDNKLQELVSDANEVKYYTSKDYTDEVDLSNVKEDMTLYVKPGDYTLDVDSTVEYLPKTAWSVNKTKDTISTVLQDNALNTKNKLLGNNIDVKLNVDAVDINTIKENTDLSDYDEFLNSIPMSITLGVDCIYSEDVHNLTSPLGITFTVPSGIDLSKPFAFVHIKDDNTVEDLTDSVIVSNNSITFQTDSFSDFVLYFDKSDMSYLVTGQDFNSKISTLAGGLFNIKNIVFADTYFTSSVRVDSEGLPVYARFNNGNIELATKASKVFLNSDSSNMFADTDSLDGLDMLTNAKLDYSLLTNSSYMFKNSKLYTDSFSTFDSSSVTTMKGMFDSSVLANASSYTSIIDELEFDLVEDTSYMLKNTTLASSDTLENLINKVCVSDNLSTVDYMFSGTTVADNTGLDLSQTTTLIWGNLAVSKVGMFSNVSGLISYKNNSNLTNIPVEFLADIPSLVTLDNMLSVENIGTDAFKVASATLPLVTNINNYKDLSDSCWNTYDWEGSNRTVGRVNLRVPAKVILDKVKDSSGEVTDTELKFNLSVIKYINDEDYNIGLAKEINSVGLKTNTKRYYQLNTSDIVSKNFVEDKIYYKTTDDTKKPFYYKTVTLEDKNSEDFVVNGQEFTIAGITYTLDKANSEQSVVDIYTGKIPLVIWGKTKPDYIN